MLTRHQIVSLILIIILSTCSVAIADTITSTTEGGFWHDHGTWVGDIVPGPGDAAVLDGPVSLSGVGECVSLVVTSSGSMAGASSGSDNLLKVHGPVQNHGEVNRGPIRLDFEIFGDLHSSGTWYSSFIILTGDHQRNLSQAGDGVLESELKVASGSAAVAVATTPLKILGHVDMTGGRLDLDFDCPLTLINCEFNGPMNANGNEVRFRTWSYLQQCQLDDAVLVGEVEAGHQVHFTTQVVVRDTLRNQPSTGGGAVIVTGNMINEGIIRATNYSFPISITGDLETHGLVACTQLFFQGVGVEHRLRMGPDGIINAPTFLPEFQAATIIAETPVRFSRGLGLGIGTLVLEPGASLILSGFAGIGSGTILANGNTITAEGSGGLGTLTLDQGVLAGVVPFSDQAICTNGLSVEGTLQSWPWASAEITVEGLLQVTGALSDGDHPVVVHARGDVDNEGTIDNSVFILDGAEDQAVGLGSGMAVPDIRLESLLPGSGHQWYRDGEVLAGQTGANLILNTAGSDDYGTYVCRQGETASRAILLASSLGLTPVPAVAGVINLRNMPNPFNPSTEISFTLPQSDEVSLVVYDLAGREVDRLLDEPMSAGDHSIHWSPRSLSSGVYLYRLQAGATILTRRCLMIK